MAAPRLTYGRRTAGARRPVLASASHIAGRQRNWHRDPHPVPGEGAPPAVESWHILTDRFAPNTSLVSLHLEEAHVSTKPSLTLKRRMNALPAKVYEAWTGRQENIALVWPRERRSIARYDGRARRRALPYCLSWTRRRGTRRGRHLPRGGAE